MTSLDVMLSQALSDYLSAKHGIKTLLLAASTPAPRVQDTVFHYGGHPWKRGMPGNCRLVIYQSRWNAVDKLIWKSRGADIFLSLEGSTHDFDQNLKKLLKT